MSRSTGWPKFEQSVIEAMKLDPTLVMKLVVTIEWGKITSCVVNQIAPMNPPPVRREEAPAPAKTTQERSLVEQKLRAMLAQAHLVVSRWEEKQPAESVHVGLPVAMRTLKAMLHTCRLDAPDPRDDLPPAEDEAPHRPEGHKAEPLAPADHLFQRTHSDQRECLRCGLTQALAAGQWFECTTAERRIAPCNPAPAQPVAVVVNERFIVKPIDPDGRLANGECCAEPGGPATERCWRAGDPARPCPCLCHVSLVGGASVP